MTNVQKYDSKYSLKNKANANKIDMYINIINNRNKLCCL